MPVGATAVVIASVPDEVIGDPVTDKIEGTESATEVTVPDVEEAHWGTPATRVKTWPVVPRI